MPAKTSIPKPIKIRILEYSNFDIFKNAAIAINVIPISNKFLGFFIVYNLIVNSYTLQQSVLLFEGLTKKQ